MGLLSFLFGDKPQQPAPQSGGLLSAPSGNQQQAYKDYAEMTMTKGQTPMSFADWQKAQAAKPAPPK